VIGFRLNGHSSPDRGKFPRSRKSLPPPFSSIKSEGGLVLHDSDQSAMVSAAPGPTGVAPDVSKVDDAGFMGRRIRN
jgi:hypothetical protein